MHPSVMKFREDFAREARLNGQYRKELGKAELLFLEEVWGPAFHYDFHGLKAEYPFKDFKGGDRFADFVYLKNGIRLVIEIDGFTTHARDLSPGDFDDHLMRQNDLVLGGWMVLRFSAHQVEKKPTICQQQIKQALGHWWALTHAEPERDSVQIWNLRKRILVDLALNQEGRLRVRDVQDRFQISPRTALNWMQRFVAEGIFEALKPAERVTGFQLKGYDCEDASQRGRTKKNNGAAKEGG